MPEKDLGAPLGNSVPKLDPGRFYVASVDESQLVNLAGYLDCIVSIFREEEGLTIVFSEDIREPVSEMTESPVTGAFALISLWAAPGRTASEPLDRICAALGGKGISVKAFSAYHHDHLLVPWGKKEETMTALGSLSGG